MLRRHTLKYLGIKERDICNSLSGALGGEGSIYISLNLTLNMS